VNRGEFDITSDAQRLVLINSMAPDLNMVRLKL